MTQRSVMSRAVPAVGLTMAIAGALALAPASAFAAEGGGSADGWEVVDTQVNGDSYEQVLYNGGVSWGVPKRIDGTCPGDFPYLDGTQGTAGKSVGQGFIVDVEDGITIGEDVGARTYDLNWADNTYVYKGSTLVATNWDFFERGVFVKMMCTKSKAKAWTQRWSPGAGPFG